MPVDPPRFLADAMLGRLAKWLRILGLDCSYAEDLTDTEILACARQEGRVLLTRDVALARKAGPGGYRIYAGKIREQIREVVEAFDLPPRPAFTRCLHCNVPVSPAAPSAVATRVPSKIARCCGPFTSCPVCGRIYWPGSHPLRATQWLKGIVRANDQA